MPKVVYVDGGNLFVVSKSPSSNKKITGSNADIVQTYTFSLEQYRLANSGRKFAMKEFFALDSSCCLDCPFSGNQRAKDKSLTQGCYTHKALQYSGFLSMLRRIKPQDVTLLDDDKRRRIVSLCDASYVRFGTYGEPSLMDATLVSQMARVAKVWTGYTHQWAKPWAKEYGSWFMASVHTESEVDLAEQLDYRSFLSKGADDPVSGVVCPASKEAGYKSTCDKCGLCSGTTGKGKKNVTINLH